MAYKKDIDYSAMIKRAAESGDMATAAQLEQSRNEKIAGEGLNYDTTSNFSSYLGKGDYKPLGDTSTGNIDYSNVIRSLISSHGSASDVGSALQSRVNKALTTPGLSQYAYDDVYNLAQKYIAANKSNDRYDNLLDSLVNREKFSYDPKTDPRYQAAATQYTNAGKKAMEDTMGEYASLTGGLPSSAAISAGQGAQNDYNSRLSSLMSNYYDTALSEYQNDFNNDLNVLSALKQDSDDSTGNAYDMAAAMIKTGKVPSNYLLMTAGMDEEYAKQMADFYAQQIALEQAAAASSSSGGGRSSRRRSSSGSSKKKESTPQVTSSYYNKFGETRYDNANKGFSASELKQFVEYVGRHRSDQGRYTAVENALDEGKITESQANSILAQFGIK